jgi:hypothetical protein
MSTVSVLPQPLTGTTSPNVRAPWSAVGVLQSELVPTLAVSLSCAAPAVVLPVCHWLQMIWADTVVIDAVWPDMVQRQSIRDRSDQQFVCEAVCHYASFVGEGEHAVATFDQAPSPEPASAGLGDERPEALFCRPTWIVGRAGSTQSVVVHRAQSRIMCDRMFRTSVHNTRWHRRVALSHVVLRAQSMSKDSLIALRLGAGALLPWHKGNDTRRCHHQ